MMDALLYYVLLPYVGLFLFTRLWYGLGRVSTGTPWCFPGAVICEAIDAAMPKWRDAAVRWISQVPERLSIWGFFCFVLWPATVGLNLLLLAQVLEIFFPGGTRIDAWGFGSYTKVSLVVGGLYSICQTVFGVIAEATKRRAVAALFILLLLLTIGGEMFLAGYRAKLVIGGEEQVAPTMADQVLSRGILLTMFISFIVPVAHSTLGFIALPCFLVPGLMYLFRLWAGMVVLPVAGILWSLFGWQRVRGLPGAVALLRAKMRALPGRVQELDAQLQDHLGDMARLRDIEPLNNLEARVNGLESDSQNEQTAWGAKLGEIGTAVAAAQAPAECTKLDGDLDRLATRIETGWRGVIARADNLRRRLKALSHDVRRWNKLFAPIAASLPNLSNQALILRGDVKAAEAARIKLKAILEPSTPDRIGYADPQEQEVEDLRQVALHAPDSRDRERARQVDKMCKQIMDNEVANGIRAMENNLNGVDARLVELTTACAAAAANPPKPPDPLQLANALTKLGSIQLGVLTASRRAKKSLRTAERDLGARRKTLRLGPAPVAKKRFFLWRLFGWVGGLFNSLVDIVFSGGRDRGGPPPSPPDAGAPPARGDDKTQGKGAGAA